MIGARWGVAQGETTLRYPCDDFLASPTLEAWRGVSVRAPSDAVWPWLTQVRVAPYSYDWIDNRGRRSPRELTPGADRLELGQTMAVVFRLVSFEDGHHWTAVTTPRGERLFGPVAMTYAAEPDPAGSRIVCRLAAAAGGPVRRSRAYALAWGDLVMMRKQLLTLKTLVERDAAARRG